MARLLSYPDNVPILSESGVYAVANAVVSGAFNDRVKTVTVETADWTGPDTSYDDAASYGSANAFYADVEHNMKNFFACPIKLKGADGYIRGILIDPLTIDQDTTRIWIFAEQAPPYDVQVLFAG